MLKGIVWPQRGYFGSGITAITSMNTQSFTKQLLDDRAKWAIVRKCEITKGDVCCLETALQRADVVGLGQRKSSSLREQRSLPKRVGDESLVDTNISELSISPRNMAISVESRPITLKRS